MTDPVVHFAALLFIAMVAGPAINSIFEGFINAADAFEINVRRVHKNTIARIPSPLPWSYPIVAVCAGIAWIGFVKYMQQLVNTPPAPNPYPVFSRHG